MMVSDDAARAEERKHGGVPGVVKVHLLERDSEVGCQACVRGRANIVSDRVYEVQ